MVISPQLNYKSYIFEFITIKLPTVVVVGATYFYQTPRDQFPPLTFIVWIIDWLLVDCL